MFDGHAGNTAARFSAKQFPIILQKNLADLADPIRALKLTFKHVNVKFKEHLKTVVCSG